MLMKSGGVRFYNKVSAGDRYAASHLVSVQRLATLVRRSGTALCRFGARGWRGQLPPGFCVVRIGLRVGLARRRITTPARMDVAGSRRRPRTELDLSAANLLHQIGNEQRDRQRDRDQNSETQPRELQCEEQLDRLNAEHAAPPPTDDATRVPSGLAKGRAGATRPSWQRI